jgi:hypothetical protein
MFSILRHSLTYTDISPDIVEHDEDIDAEEWSYGGRQVYRGALDLTYKSKDLDVFWLYDDNSDRIGLAEHNADDHSDFRALWFYDNDYGTLLQEDWEPSEKTVWSLMTPESYQDNSTLSYMDLAVRSNGKLIIPDFLINDIPEVYTCETCNQTSLLPITCRDAVKKKLPINLESIFIDSSGIVCVPPSNSKVIKWLSGDDRRPFRDVLEHSRAEEQQHLRESDQHQLPQTESPQEEAPPLPQTELQQSHVTEETPAQT